MKRTAILAAIAFSFALPTCLKAQDTPPSAPVAQNPPPSSMRQDHFEAGVFANYLSSNFADGLGFPTPPSATHFAGVGGRASFNVRPNLAVEAQMSYDLERNYTYVFNDGLSSFATITTVQPLSALFGPKLQYGGNGPFRVFATAKAGFIDFTTGYSYPGSPAADSSRPEKHVAFYPGGGVEVFAGRLGLRVEAGDEIYWNSGTYNNLSVDAGPVIRF